MNRNNRERGTRGSNQRSPTLDVDSFDRRRFDSLECQCSRHECSGPEEKCSCDVAVTQNGIAIEVHEVPVEYLKQGQSLRLREHVAVERLRIDHLAQYFDEVRHELFRYTYGAETAAAGGLDADTIA